MNIIKKKDFTIPNYPLNFRQPFELTSVCHHYPTLKLRYQNSTSRTRSKQIQIPRYLKAVSDKNSYLIAIRKFKNMPNDYKILNYNKQTTRKKLKEWLTRN